MKHRRLNERPGTLIYAAPAVPSRLDDKMNMCWLPSRMRPQADIHLVRLGEILYGLGYPLQKRADFFGFSGGEIPDMEAVTERLDD